MTREYTPITPSNEFGEPSIVSIGQATEVAVWRSQYNGKNQITFATRHPQRTGGHWKVGMKSLDSDVSVAAAQQMMGWTIGEAAPAAKSPAVEAPKRGRKPAAK